jgi:hypothetical protein
MGEEKRDLVEALRASHLMAQALGVDWGKVSFDVRGGKVRYLTVSTTHQFDGEGESYYFRGIYGKEEEGDAHDRRGDRGSE